METFTFGSEGLSAQLLWPTRWTFNSETLFRV
jgi:hypothetical protein